MRPFTVWTLAAVIALTVLPAAANDHVVTQSGRQFLPKELTAKVGETVVFQNKDSFAHNIYSATPGHEFNLNSQAPNQDIPHKLKKAGEVQVQCAIHPKMKMTIKVEN